MRVTIQDIQALKTRGERFVMLTAYDYATARLLDGVDVPLLLVGDSLAMVMLGHETTLGATMGDLIRHTQAVARGTTRPLVVADLPFLSYQVSIEDALRNAGRLLRDGGAQAVKLEGGAGVAPTVTRLVEAGIPVMGHLGLTPQSVNQLGGYRIQGKQAPVAARLLEDAEALQRAGAFAIVLEGMPAQVAARITRQLDIPTIGIGAGIDCDGQVQVIHDLLGLFTDFVPRHARRYAELGAQVQDAARAFVADVRDRRFPGERESVVLTPTELRAFDAQVGA